MAFQKKFANMNILMVYGQLQEEGVFQDTNVPENMSKFVSQKYQNTKTHGIFLDFPPTLKLKS